MCGIVGVLVYTASGFQISDQYLTRMRDVLRHRGPDGGGNWIAANRRIGLGHRRLSIIDLSKMADQPMSNEDGTLQVVFNGEIYNHAEIRRELEILGGHTWRTSHSDTEVILHAFEQWGIACIEKFRGMFAIALWDARRQELWLIRDRLGIKPLYYSRHHGRLVFASEIKALFQDRAQPRTLNVEMLFHYLTFLTTPAPQTLFEGIFKIPPATWLRFNGDTGAVVEHRYWDVWDHVRPRVRASDAELADEVLDELRRSVYLHKIGDVPVGVFLSGGLDSSTNAALFSEGEKSSVKTFTIGYQGDNPSSRNETVFARQMADGIHAQHHERLLSQDDLLAFLSRMVYLQDEPIADPVCVPIHYVSKLARENGVTVCQVGEGADELFCGYSGWFKMLKYQRYLRKFPWQPGLRGLHHLSAWCGYDHTLTCEWFRRAADNRPIFWGGAEAFPHRLKMAVLSERLRRQFAGYTSWSIVDTFRQRFEANAWDPSDLNWMTYLDINMRLPELLLMRVDKMSMGNSLECRVPFLDHKFVELALSLPSEAKIRGGMSKYLLKRAVRGLVPDALVDRPKQGFSVPIYEWFLDRLGGMARHELQDFCGQTDYFDPKTVDDLFVQRRGQQIWYLLNFVLWWKRYMCSEDPLMEMRP